MSFQIDEILFLLVAVAVLALLARKISIPYPILLVLGGLALALALEDFPNLPKMKLEPDLVFLIFLPPLLFPAALFTSWRDFRANLRPISLLAVGLVLFTTVSVGYFAHHLVEGLPLAAAFILGAIISPPDAVAATAITERLRVPRRIVTVLEGESLVNDAIALVAYRFAVVALATGSFSLGEATLKFIIVSVGGVLVGLSVGWLASQAQRRLDDPPVQITISILTPFAAYLPAEQFEVSGVLAVVTAGLYLGWRAPEIIGSRMRLQAGPVWQMIEFILNGMVFILIGLQLPDIWKGLAGLPIPVSRICWYAFLISVLVIVVRFIWVFAASYLPRYFSKRLRQRDPYPPWRTVVIVAWTGMRGVVSLAAALALPSMIHKDIPPLGRDAVINLIIFFTSVVILVTLVLQGLTLPVLIRWLKVESTGETEREEREARLKANLSAMARLAELEEGARYPTELLQRLRVEYEDRIRQLEACDQTEGEGARWLFSSEYENLQQDALDVERQTIVQLRNERIINDVAMRRIQRDLDLAEARLRGGE
ncbi:MAG: Na+/H+ antiporter [Pedosphaera sp.]|nr:Na+/H+ antiporter [Pedosphaera sp.]